MLQLNPRETFTIVRQIEDHTDTNTYYVRAVVRNAKTDELLANVDLDSKGNQRYSKDYIVPADVSGQGFWLSITTSVYTDSGHTTKSENYGDKLDSYLVQERYQFNPNYPIPVGPDIDYKRIEKIVDKIVTAKVKKETPEPKIITVEKIVEKVVKVPEIKEVTKEVVKEVKVPVEPNIDWDKFSRMFASINASINALNRPQIMPEAPEAPEELELPEAQEEPSVSPFQPRIDRLLGKTIISERTKKLL
jgi:hypothetical protein